MSHRWASQGLDILVITALPFAVVVSARADAIAAPSDSATVASRCCLAGCCRSAGTASGAEPGFGDATEFCLNRAD